LASPSEESEAEAKRWQIDRRGSHCLLRLQAVGSRVGAAQRLSAVFKEAMSTLPETLAMEFTDTLLLDSSCIGQIVKAIRALGMNGKTVYCICDDRVWETLTIVGLEGLLLRKAASAEYWLDVGG